VCGLQTVACLLLPLLVHLCATPAPRCCSLLLPLLPHASSAKPVQVGEGVQSLSPGDAVALEPGVPCWHCSAARDGRYNLDPDIQFFATPPVHGSLATYVDHPVEMCYKLPEGVTLEEGAMCEPLSVGIHACRWGLSARSDNEFISEPMYQGASSLLVVLPLDS
jgi:threonine dehydrogenase-like Zn-dependent dehydrogenase